MDQLEPQLRAYVTEGLVWVRQSPRDAQRHATLGMIYAVNNLWFEARGAFSNTVRLNSNEPLAHMYLAVATQELGMKDEALQILRSLTNRFPRFAPGYYRLGEALLRAGAVDDATPCFDRLTVLEPREWRGFANLGDIKLRKGQADVAVKLLERAVALDPQAKPAHFLLGQAYQKAGRATEAQRELRLGMNATHYPMPDDWSVQAPRHLRLLQDQIDAAREFIESGHPAKAIALLEGALAYYPTNLTLLNNLAIACNSAGERQKARLLAEKAVVAEPRYLAGHVTLSAVLLALDQKDQAMKHAERAIELSPNTPQPHVAKANVHLAMQQDAEALVELETAARCDPQNAQLQLEMGEIRLRNLGQPAQALANYKRASELDPGMAPAWVRQVEIHLRDGRAAEARSAIEALRSNAPGLPIIPALADWLKRVEEGSK
jgi:tetratricopeptide (TPR) repeat protein